MTKLIKTFMIVVAMLSASPVFAEDTTQASIATTIGQLVIQNAQLSSQRDALQKQNDMLAKRLQEFEAKSEKTERAPAK